jgi:predicted nucleic acid-binding protein
MLLVVLDTNILISYLLGSRTISYIIESFHEEKLIPALSSELEQEFLRTINLISAEEFTTE